MNRVLAASLAGALPACIAVNGHLNHIATLPASSECRAAPPTADLRPGGDRIVLQFHDVTSCPAGPRVVYRQERAGRVDSGWRLGLSLAAGLAVVLPVSARLAAEDKYEPYPEWVSRTGERNLTRFVVTTVGAAAVVGVGLLSHVVLSAWSVPLPAQELEFDAEPPSRHLEPAIAKITGHGQAPLGETSVEGTLSLELDAAPAIADGELYVDGRRADLLRGTAARLAALTACREAVAGPPVSLERNQLAAARCAESGWSFAR